MAVRAWSWRLGLSLVATWLSAFPNAGGQPGAPPLSLEYKVQVTDPGSRELHVSLALHDVDLGHPLALHSVPAYMANPLARSASKKTVSHFTCRSVRGEPIEVVTEGNGVERFVIRHPEPELQIEYDVKVEFEETEQTREYPIRIPFMSSTQTLLYGNYIFCYPELSENKQAAAGQVLPIRVVFSLPGDVRLWGVPEDVTLHTIYQLMSLQFGWGAETVERFATSGINISLVFEKENEFKPAERTALRSAVSTAVQEVVSFFGGAPVDQYTFFFYRGEGIGGMEGTSSCQVYIEEGKDVTKVTSTDIRMFNSVIAHEFFHTWNPIHAYPREDPWIKEGFTCYYGEVLSVRSGLLRESDLENSYRYYFRQLERNLVIGTVALTDPRVWENEYLNENWRTITYERGRAVALLLDVAIREKTANARSLDDVMRLLYDRYKESCYSHEQVVEAVKAATGQDFREFFARYVTGARCPSQTEVERARRKMRELGVLKQPAVPVARSAQLAAVSGQQ